MGLTKRMDYVHIRSMLLTEWAKKRSKEPDCRGVFTELFRKSGVSYKTVLRIARDGNGTDSFEVAEKLSAATNGESSVDEIRFPARYKNLPEKRHKRNSLPPSAA